MLIYFLYVQREKWNARQLVLLCVRVICLSIALNSNAHTHTGPSWQFKSSCDASFDMAGKTVRPGDLIQFFFGVGCLFFCCRMKCFVAGKVFGCNWSEPNANCHMHTIFSVFIYAVIFFFSRYKQLDTSVGHSPESIDGTMLCRAAHNNKIEGSRRHINEWVFDYHSISSTYPNCKWSGWYHQNNTLTVTWDCLCWMHIYFPHTRTLDFCATSVLSCRRFLFFSLCLLQLFNEYLTHNGTNNTNLVPPTMLHACCNCARGKNGRISRF